MSPRLASVPRSRPANPCASRVIVQRWRVFSGPQYLGNVVVFDTLIDGNPFFDFVKPDGSSSGLNYRSRGAAALAMVGASAAVAG